MATSSIPAGTIPTIDLSSLGPNGSQTERDEAIAQLRDACTTLGFANLKGVGLSPERIDEMFRWTKKLFDLSVEEKMKAPHPAEAMPHRGYSGAGVEKVYSKAERDAEEQTNGDGKDLRQIKDHKESYEVGSESNTFQPNIWLPDSVLPGYKKFALGLYDDMHTAAHRILDALCLALNLSPEDTDKIKSLHSGQNNQLRLLHYPPIETEKLASKVVGRMPPHQDWSTFTFLFQDSVGGLELLDPRSGEYLQSKPEQGVCIFNVGDMLMRYSNGRFPSAMHRVTLPPPVQGKEDGITRGRYSIPYFFAPDHEGMVNVLPSLLKGEKEKYEALRWCDYGEYMAKYMYNGSEKENEVTK